MNIIRRGSGGNHGSGAGEMRGGEAWAFEAAKAAARAMVERIILMDFIISFFVVGRGLVPLPVHSLIRRRGGIPSRGGFGDEFGSLVVGEDRELEGEGGAVAEAVAVNGQFAA